jgi:cell division protein FtsZ
MQTNLYRTALSRTRRQVSSHTKRFYSATTLASHQPFTPLYQEKCEISVLGVGGAGCNAVDNMVRSGIQGVKFFVSNTDAQALSKTVCDQRIQIGIETTRGLGAGAMPVVGRKSAEEDIEAVMEQIKDSQMLFITAGMGGGTGTGAAPVIGAEAKKRGILTVAVITTPFSFEGAKRYKTAVEGLRELEKCVDTVIIVPNENIFNVSNRATTVTEAFKIADDVLLEGVKGITDVILQPSLINLDFADVRTVMKDGGRAFMGTGFGFSEQTMPKSGPMAVSPMTEGNRQMESNSHNELSKGKAAVLGALHNPLLDVFNIAESENVLLSISGGPDLTLFEVQDIANIVKEQVNEDTNIIIGTNTDEKMRDTVKVSLVVTGIPKQEFKAEPIPKKTSLSSDKKSRGGFLEFLTRHW